MKTTTIFEGIGIAATIIVMALLTMLIIEKKKTNRYYLGIDSDISHGNSLVIVRDIDWYLDDKIVLDRNITYEKAIELVNSLNETLK